MYKSVFIILQLLVICFGEQWFVHLCMCRLLSSYYLLSRTVDVVFLSASLYFSKRGALR